MIAIGVKYVLLAALLAQASDPAAPGGDKARAKALLQEGLAFNQQGRHAQALGKFQAAYAAYPSPKLWFNIGQVQVALDHPLEAVQAFEDFLALASDARPEDRKDASTALAQLGKKLGRLQIKCETVGAQISVDGKSVGRVPLPEPLWAMPGRHGVTIAQSGFVPATETVDLGAGATALVVIRLLPVPPPAPVALPKPGERIPAAAAPAPGMAIAPSGVAAAAGAPAQDQLLPTQPAVPPPAAVAATAAPATPVALDLSTQPAPAEQADQARPFYKTWWFWTGTAVVVAGVVTAVLLLTRDAGSNVPDTNLGNHGVFQ
jgi:hypothetical protein